MPSSYFKNGNQLVRFAQGGLRASSILTSDLGMNWEEAISTQSAATHEYNFIGPTGGAGWIVSPGSTIAQGYRGADPRYESLAGTYWPRRNDADVIAWGTWRAILPWFVSYRGEAGGVAPVDTATNTCIEVLSMSCQVRRESNAVWENVQSQVGYSWVAPYAFSTIGGPSGTIQNPSANKFIQDSNSAAHGGLGRTTLPLLNDNPDIDAIYVRLVARLAKINEALPSDFDQSNLQIACGADFYPTSTTSASVVAGASGWLPGCGYGRGKWVRPTAREFTLLATKAGISYASLNQPPLIIV